MSKNVQEVLGVSLEKVKEMFSSDTVIGTPVELDGIKIIPVSRITCGVVGGGADLPFEKISGGFGGGSGAGVNVVPVAFLVVKNGDVSILPVQDHPSSLDAALSMIPGTVDKITGVLNNAINKRRAESYADDYTDFEA